MRKQKLNAIQNDAEKEQKKINDANEKEEQNKNVVSSTHKKIRKCKWQYRCSIFHTIKQNHCFYLYGSLVLHTNYDLDTLFSTQTIDLILHHQQMQSVAINKQIGAIETNFNVMNPGIVDFNFLVKRFENKQLQIYFDFAKSLKDLQISVNTVNQFVIEKQKELKSMPELLDLLDQQYFQFEKWANDLIEKHFKDEFFGYTLYQNNYRKGYAEMKKQVNSQNSISLFGESLNDIYEAELCKMKNKSIFFERYQDFNIDLFLENLTFNITANSSKLQFQKKQITFSTIEGFQLPGTMEIYKLKYYDYKKDDPNIKFISEKDYIMIITLLKVDDLWLKRLIDIRKELQDYQKPNNPPFKFESSSENNIDSFSFNEEDKDILSTIRNTNYDKIYLEPLDQEIDTCQNVQQCIPSSLNFSSEVQNDNQLSNTKEEQYFTPEVIDLTGNKEHQDYLSKQVLQLQQKKKIAQNLNKYFSQKQQELELSNIEYSCQVEYLLDKFYSSDHEMLKNNQFKQV
ncbi:hypothetical protein ABPG74_010193 [Tetrahymena malaccensis]